MKTLYLAPTPRTENFLTTERIWNGLEQKNLRGVKIVGIQAHSTTKYSIIDNPEDFKEVKGIWDTDVAPMLAFCLINKDWLTKEFNWLIREHSEYRWKSDQLCAIYPTTPATEFGFALGGCGRMGAQMTYPWVRVQSTYEPGYVIELTRKNYNINCLTAPALQLEDHKDMTGAAEIMLTTDFTGDSQGLEANKRDILRRNRGMQACLEALGLAALRQVH